jgi:hypothetical protein
VSEQNPKRNQLDYGKAYRLTHHLDTNKDRLEALDRKTLLDTLETELGFLVTASNLKGAAENTINSFKIPAVKRPVRASGKLRKRLDDLEARVRYLEELLEKSTQPG